MNKIKILIISAILYVAAFGLVTAQSTDKIILVSDNAADNAVAESVGELKGYDVVSTPWGDYEANVVEYIQGLNPKEVLIIGGPAAVPSDYETALLNFTNTIRVAGKDRYATVARVLELFKEDFKGKGAVAAYGYDKKGIEKALEKAKAKGLMVVFVDRNTVPWEVQKALENANISSLDVEESPNMNTTEIEDEVTDDVGNVSFTSVDHSSRAFEQIQEARDAIAKTEETLTVLNITATASLRLLDNAKDNLGDAEKAFNESKYGEAFGLAVAAEHLAENAGKIAKDLQNYEKESHKEKRGLEEKITEKIQHLREKISEQKEKVIEAESRGVSTKEAVTYLEEATLTLGEAEDYLNNNDTVGAVGRLREASNLIAHAKVSLKTHEEGEKKEFEIKVNFKGGAASVKVDINNEKTRFTLGTTNKTQIIAEIAKRTGLTISEISKAIKYEKEEPENEVEIEVEVEGGSAKVKVKVSGSEEEFTLNTNNREEIVSSIIERTGLARAQVEKNIKFKGNHAKLGGQKIEKNEKKEVGKKEDVEKKGTVEKSEEEGKTKETKKNEESEG
jgi:putative cell wall-binding protein/DNA-binding phage protein